MLRFESATEQDQTNDALGVASKETQIKIGVRPALTPIFWLALRRGRRWRAGRRWRRRRRLARPVSDSFWPDRAVNADQFRRLDRPGSVSYLGAFRLQRDVEIQVKGLLSSANLHIASSERLLARGVAILQEDPISVRADSRLAHILDVDAVEERARAVDRRLAVDAGLRAAFAHDGQNAQRLYSQGLGGPLILVRLLA